MVKNIPNKYEQDALLETINKNHSKNYDFFYLPIDFAVIENYFKFKVFFFFVELVQCGLCIY